MWLRGYGTGGKIAMLHPKYASHCSIFYTGQIHTVQWFIPPQKSAYNKIGKQFILKQMNNQQIETCR